MAKNMKDPRNWAKWRASGAMPKTSNDVFHCVGENGCPCGHIGEGVLKPEIFATKQKGECCPACWEFAKSSGLVERPVVKHQAYHGEPLPIPRSFERHHHLI